MKLNCIMLIDDDEPTNFYNEHVITQSDICNSVKACQSGAEALEYLSNQDKENHPRPDLIFVDINMPAMNGWEFLEHYEKLPTTDKSSVIVMMLTTSLNPDDEKKAENYNLISGFKRKPLTEAMLKDIVNDLNK